MNAMARILKMGKESTGRTFIWLGGYAYIVRASLGF